MSFARFKETFFHLPKQVKFIGIGALILLVAAFLPWYADLDSYKIGDEFLGITGPASFVGIVIVLLSGFSLWIFSYHLLERRVPRLPVREAIIHLGVAVESLFLLLLVASIYFHPKFGVNITLKEIRFGMTIAFAGAIVLFIGGYLQNREEIRKSSDSGRLEPLIKLEPTPTPPPTPVSTGSHQPAYQRPHSSIPMRPTIEPRKISPYANPTTKGFLFGEKAPIADKPKQPEPESKSEKNDKGSGSYVIRMDL